MDVNGKGLVAVGAEKGRKRDTKGAEKVGNVNTKIEKEDIINE